MNICQTIRLVLVVACSLGANPSGHGSTEGEMVMILSAVYPHGGEGGVLLLGVAVITKMTMHTAAQ